MAAQEVPEYWAMGDIPYLVQKMFGIDLVREMILNYAIRRRKGQLISGTNVSSLRLVQKSWLKTITKLLQKSKEPLFKFVLNEDNSLHESVGEDGKLLDRFLNAMATKPSLPTFSIKILEDVFEQENHSSLSRMLVHFGAGLVQLELHIPVDSLEFIFPNFTLPALRKLSVKLSEIELEGPERNNSNVSHFINSLLNASPALTHFVIPFGSYHDQDDPLAFQFFTLPPSITTLELSCWMSNEHLELLVKNHLPKLTSLTLSIPADEAYPDGLLFRILDKCRTTLRKLRLQGKAIMNIPRPVTSLRFPIMEKLETISCYSAHYLVETGTDSLETFLPKLSRLTLINVTADMFRKWTENSSFKSGCQTIKCCPVQGNVRGNHPDYLASVNLERMQSIHLAFPNVRNLEVTVRETRVCGLKYLFMEMRNLVFLKIVVGGSTVDLDWDFWDALLIGVPIDLARAVRGYIEFWEEAQLINASAPTIKNLRELKHLQLETHRTCTHDPSVTDPLISDLTFLLALLQMPNLRELTFKGKFRASDEMAERWRTQGRKLVYYAVQ